MSGGGREHRLVVDRIEGDLVVVELEDGATVDLPRWLLPTRLKEGAVVRVQARTEQGRRVVELEVDEAETLARREEARETVQRLRRRDPGGDIVL